MEIVFRIAVATTIIFFVADLAGSLETSVSSEKVEAIYSYIILFIVLIGWLSVGIRKMKKVLPEKIKDFNE